MITHHVTEYLICVSIVIPLGVYQSVLIIDLGSYFFNKREARSHSFWWYDIYDIKHRICKEVAIENLLRNIGSKDELEICDNCDYNCL